MIMYSAIQTVWRMPTDHRSGKIVVKTEQTGPRGKAYSWDYAQNPQQNHVRAACEYATYMGWEGTWYGGASPDGKGWVFVRVYTSPGEGAPESRDGAAFVVPAK